MHVICVRCLEEVVTPNALTLNCPIDDQELPLPMGGIGILPTDDRVVSLLIAASKDQSRKEAKQKVPRSPANKRAADRKVARRSLTEDDGPSLEEQEAKIRQQIQEIADEIRQLVTTKEEEITKKVGEAFAKLKEGKPVNTTLLQDIVSAASQFGQTDQDKPSRNTKRRNETVILDLTPSRKILQSLKVEGLAAVQTGRKSKLSVGELPEESSNRQAILLNNVGATDSYRDVADITSTLAVPISMRGMFNPGAVATSRRDGRIAVTDYGNECVWLFSATGLFESRVSGDGEEGELESPDGIAFLSDGTLVVADAPFEETQSLYLYDSEGKVEGCLLEMPEEEEVSFGRIFVDGDDRIMVICGSNENSIQVYDRDGDLLLEFGQSELNGPEKVLFHDGKFFVSDTNAASNRCCIKVFDGSGQLLQSFDEDKYTLGQTDNLGLDINYPILLTVDASNDRLLAYHGFTKELKVYKVDGTPVKQIKTVSGAKDIALTSDGKSIVITCGEDSIMQKTVQLVRYQM